MPTTPNTNEQMNPQRQRPNGGYTPIYRRRLFHENSNQSVSQQARERRELRSQLFAQLQQLKSNKNNVGNRQINVKQNFKRQRAVLSVNEKNQLRQLQTEKNRITRNIKKTKLSINQTKVKVPGKIRAFVGKLTTKQ